MENLEVIEILEQANDAMIEKLYWIAASIDCSDLKNLFEEMDTKYLQKYFPKIVDEIDSIDRYEFREKLLEMGKFGFIAEIHIPIASDFIFNEKGEPSAWSSNRGCSRVEYVYAETSELLLEEIVSAAEITFREFVEKAKNKVDSQ